MKSDMDIRYQLAVAVTMCGLWSPGNHTVIVNGLQIHFLDQILAPNQSNYLDTKLPNIAYFLLIFIR